MSKEMVNHPSHYNQYPKETIDMMVDIFGREATRQWCVMTAFKYRMRLGLKDDMSLPAWECGLKLVCLVFAGCGWCHSPRGSVD